LEPETDSSGSNAERMLPRLLQQSCTLQLGEEETPQMDTMGAPAISEGAKLLNY